MKKIKLTQGKYALVDDNDFEFLNKYKWCARRTGSIFYAVRNEDRKTILMHRMIMKPEPEKEIDHIDSDGLNNQRKNLRPCTHQENLRNQRIRKNNKTGYLGVSFYNRTQQYVSFISFQGKSIGLGYFSTAEAAHNAYIKACKKYYNGFSKFN